jgi:hypothetical protein
VDPSCRKYKCVQSYAHLVIWARMLDALLGGFSRRA